MSTKEVNVLAGGGTFKETQAEVTSEATSWPEIPWGLNSSHSKNRNRLRGELTEGPGLKGSE